LSWVSPNGEASGVVSENARYHITSRVSRRENIFDTDKDKPAFLERLDEALNKRSLPLYGH
jgi:hypothetical protein